MFNRRDGGKRTEKKQKGMRSHLQVMSRISKKLHLAVRLITGKRRIAAIFRAVKVLEELHNGENVSKKRKKKGKGRSLNCTLAPNMRLIVRQLSCCGTCWRGILHFIPPPPRKKNTHRRPAETSRLEQFTFRRGLRQTVSVSRGRTTVEAGNQGRADGFILKSQNQSQNEDEKSWLKSISPMRKVKMWHTKKVNTTVTVLL